MNRHDHTPHLTLTSRRRTGRRRRLITPLMAGAVVAASVLAILETPATQTLPAKQAAGTEVTGAGWVLNTQTRMAAVRPVSLTRPAPGIRGSEPLTCPAGRSDTRGRSGQSTIQIEIRLEQPTRGSSRREPTRRDSDRRGGQPLVVGCGPDGQIVVLACDTRRTQVDRDPWGSRERRDGYRDRTRFDTDRDNYDRDYDRYDLADLQDLELSDLLDLSDATGLSLDQLVERAELDGLQVDGPTGRIEIGNPQRRSQSRRSDTTRAGWWDLYTTPRTGVSDSDGTATRSGAPASNGSSSKAQKARTARLVRAGDRTDPSPARGLRDRGERSGVCRWLGH